MTARAEGPRMPAHLDVPIELQNHPDYEVLRELGRGAVGVVYLARHRLMGRLEVLKVLHGGPDADPATAQRFLNEVKLVARLSHPNIVEARGAFRAGGLVVLAMEYVEGTTLQALVRERGPLPVRHACHYAGQAARGLQAAHKLGLIHRDVKPDNLMLTPQGFVKVLDFGLAKATGGEGAMVLTGGGAMLGTPSYMAPEQSVSARDVDIRADIYALGCTLFFLLTGKPPFTGRSTFDVIIAHHRQPPPPLATFCPGLPPALADLVARMMSKAPGDRPATPGDVVQSLGRLLGLVRR
jgi:serine/threonine protein kinase